MRNAGMSESPPWGGRLDPPQVTWGSMPGIFSPAPWERDYLGGSLLLGDAVCAWECPKSNGMWRSGEGKTRFQEKSRAGFGSFGCLRLPSTSQARFHVKVCLPWREHGPRPAVPEPRSQWWLVGTAAAQFPSSQTSSRGKTGGKKEKFSHKTPLRSN